MPENKRLHSSLFDFKFFMNINGGISYTGGSFPYFESSSRWIPYILFFVAFSS